MAHHPRKNRNTKPHGGSDFRPPKGHPASYEPKAGSGPSILSKAVDDLVFKSWAEEEESNIDGHAALNPSVPMLRKSLTQRLHLRVFPQDKEFSNPLEAPSFTNPVNVTRQLLHAEPGTPQTKSVDVQVRKADGTVVTERHALPGSMIETRSAKLLWQSDRDLLDHRRTVGDVPLHMLKRQTAYTKEVSRDETNRPLPANLGPGMVLTETIITTEEGIRIPESKTPVVDPTFERCPKCYRSREIGKACICGYVDKPKAVRHPFTRR